jgi:hypothetical protein
MAMDQGVKDLNVQQSERSAADELLGSGEASADRGLAGGHESSIVGDMSTITEIESALEKLPVEAQREVAA